jgi:hypothetical protein
MTNDWSIFGTVVIDVLLSFNLAAMFPLPLTPAQLLSDGLPIKGCAANMTNVLITHHYNGAANHVAPLQ